MILTGAFSGAVIAADSADSSRIIYFNDFNEDIYKKTTITPKSNSISLYEGKKNLKALKIAAADGKAVEDALVSLNAKSDFEKIVVSMDLSVEVGGAMVTFQYCDSENNRGKLFKTKKDSSVMSSATNTTLTSLESGKWTNVAYAVDFSKNTYNAYINGKIVEKDKELAVKTGKTISWFRLYMEKNCTGDLLVDNLAIYEGDKPRNIDEEVAAMPRSQPTIGAIESGTGKNYEINYADMSKLDGAVALLLGSSNAYAKGSLTVVDEQNKEVMPVVVNNRTLVPVRFVAENFGADVSWNGDEQKASVALDGKVIDFIIDSPQIIIDGTASQTDVAPTVINNRTMLPLRALAESLGKDVLWDQRGLILITNSNAALDETKDQRLISAIYGYLKTGNLALNYAAAPVFTKDILDAAFNAPDFDYNGEKGNTPNGAIAAKSLYYLTLAAHLDETAASSDGKLAKDEAKRRLKDLISGGKEPFACTGAYWSHAVVAADLVLIKNTPVIYNELTEDEKQRMDWLMRALAIAGNWGFNDANNYSTGFDLLGNFGKGWNPNYRNTYLNVVISGAMYFGAEELDKIFTSFSYDEYVKKFEEFGYKNILSTWTVAGKDVMEKGGAVVLKGGIGLSNMKEGDSGGTGSGVKIPFKYNGMGLDNINGIFAMLENYTYSAVGQDKYGSPDGEYYCYIISGKESPYNGYNGMMYEFAASKRSSAGYCYDSMMIVMPMYANFKLLYGWDSTQDWQKKLDSLIYIGTEDLIFKLTEGYHGYSSSSGSHSDEFEYSKTSMGYKMDKDIWRNFHCMGNEEVTTAANPDAPIELLPAPAAEPENGITKAPAGATLPTIQPSSGEFSKDSAISIGEYKKTFESEFDLTFDKDVISSTFDGVVIFDGSGAKENPISFKKANILIQFNSGRINIRNGNKYFQSQFPVAANYKYHFRVSVDVANKKYSVWISQSYPTVREEVLVAKDMAYREGAGAINDIGTIVPVQVSKTGGYWIENLKYSGE